MLPNDIYCALYGNNYNKFEFLIIIIQFGYFLYQGKFVFF